MTRISWTNKTWNPTTGCDRISPGCDNCYALTLSGRLKAMGQEKYQTDGPAPTSGPGFGVATHPDALGAPLRRRRPTMWFVNSMSDLFHARVPTEFVTQVWAVMAATPWHTYQVLTKRPGRMRQFVTDECGCGGGHAPGVHLRSAMEWAATPHSDTYVPGLEPGLYHRMTWPLPNVWLGTSVETQKCATLRVPHLLATPAAVRFVSAEPLLDAVDLTPWMAGSDHHGPWHYTEFGVLCSCGAPVDTDERCTAPGIDWVITGGESGPHARPARGDWFRQIRDDCEAAGVAYWHKQNGTCYYPGAGADVVQARGNGGDLLDGHRYQQYPPVVTPAAPPHKEGTAHATTH